MKIPPVKKGDKIYVNSSYYLSHGSDDFEGGIATVSKVTENMSAGNKTPFVEIKERPGSSYDWKELSKKQKELKKEFGTQKAHPKPDVDRPWIEPGDIVNGQIYKGKPIW